MLLTYNGIVVVNKPAGMTSHDVVGVARKMFHTKRIGHTGTLDPDATGVLVLCVGNATRLAEYLSAARKNYVTEVVFGVETDTQDASGNIVTVQDASHLTEAEVRALLPRFRGTILQIPPMVSARHHQGKRLYELAREGVTVEREARPVEIERLELLGFTSGEHPVVTLDVTCSTGTYIRTLAADLGAAAGVGGMMRSLQRVWVGENAEQAFALADAHTLDDLRARDAEGTLAGVVLPLTAALRAWPQVHLSEEALTRLIHGQAIPLAAQEIPAYDTQAEERPIAVLDAMGDLCVVARLRTGQLQPVKVLAQHERV